VKSRENKLIAESLREAAVLLEQQRANPFRVGAYRKAADTVEELPLDIGIIFRTDGLDGLMRLPGVGPQIGSAIVELIRTGQWTQLQRLRGVQDPEALFARVPGIGDELARRVVNQLHLDTLEALEVAAYDGRLKKVQGFGPRRLLMVRAALAEMLGRGRDHRRTGHEPPVDVLLDVDREYRQKAAANKLRLIAPRRFNPRNEQWLPILHSERGDWHFTALFSNTPLAHSLGRTRDWVIMYFQSDAHEEGQRTIVTETRGPLTGERVIRGREEDCAEYYRSLKPHPSNAA